MKLGFRARSVCIAYYVFQFIYVRFTKAYGRIQDVYIEELNKALLRKYGAEKGGK